MLNLICVLQMVDVCVICLQEMRPRGDKVVGKIRAPQAMLNVQAPMPKGGNT